MSECSATWTRYFSRPFLAAKWREKGFLGCLKAVLGKVSRRLPLSFVLYPLALFLRLIGIRFLDISLIERIGHIAIEPDLYLKAGALNIHPAYKGVLLVPKDKVANQHLLSYWKPYFKIVTSPQLCRWLAPLARQQPVHFYLGRYLLPIHKTALYHQIQNAWHGQPPLLTLSDFDRRRGWECLRALGLPEDAWFVCVHGRESGYGGTAEGQLFRDTDISTYIPAMEAVIAQGGWCIRMGDPTMKPLPPMSQVIDYAHLDIKSDWMDVFLCASCKFFLGSTSGLCCVPSVFGVACAQGNLSPMATAPYGADDIYIPKLYWSDEEERYLSFKEVLDSPAAILWSAHEFAKLKLRTVDNTPDDIKDLALEMLERVTGRVAYDDKDQSLQKRFKALLKPGDYSYGCSSRVGRAFLRKHEWLLRE